MSPLASPKVRTYLILGGTGGRSKAELLGKSPSTLLFFALFHSIFDRIAA
jgi:hypothetical protein